MNRVEQIRAWASEGKSLSWAGENLWPMNVEAQIDAEVFR